MSRHRRTSAILQLFACKNQMLLARRNVLLALDFSFDILMASLGSAARVMVLPQDFRKDLHLCVGWGGCSDASLKSKSRTEAFKKLILKCFQMQTCI